MQMKFTIEQFIDEQQLYFTDNISWIIINGCGELYVGNQCYKVRPKDFLRLPVETQCCFKAQEPVTAGVIYLFDMVSTRKECSLIPARETQLIYNTFFLALDVENCDNPNKSKLKNAVWQLMWEAIIGSGVKLNPSNMCIANVLEKIDRNYQDSNFNLGEIIDNTGYSRGHFRKMFKDQTGVPPLEHLNLRRLEHAKKLMWQEHGKVTVKEVAERSGFSDANNFTKFFKRTMGITPGQYIDQIVVDQT